MIRNPTIELPSISSVQLEMKRDNTKLATGTGFLWELPDGNTALVTAWHNVSGLHHTTRAAIHTQGGTPNKLTLKMMTKNPKQFLIQDIDLYLDKHEEEPRWLVHHKYGSYLDFCFIPMRFQEDVSTINTNFSIEEPVLTPGSEIFTIGFPNNISVAAVFPVWKRGSIASDASLPIEGHPKYLIDMTGRSGMSGAPVVRPYTPFSQVPQSQNNLNGEFVGIYTGRAASSSKESSEIGFVWHTKYIKEMLENYTIDEKPEPGKGFWKHEERLFLLNNS